MLIQLTSRFTIDPTQYPHRLVVELETGDETGDGFGGQRSCGVFSGMHDGFEDPSEMNRWIDGSPINGITPWIQRYEIQAPNRSQPSRCRRYHYVAVGWHGGVYAAYPVPTEIVLEDSAGSWSVSIRRGDGVTVILPDYSPWNQG